MGCPGTDDFDVTEVIVPKFMLFRIVQMDPVIVGLPKYDSCLNPDSILGRLGKPYHAIAQERSPMLLELIRHIDILNKALRTNRGQNQTQIILLGRKVYKTAKMLCQVHTLFCNNMNF